LQTIETAWSERLISRAKATPPPALPRNDQNDDLHAGDPGSRKPSQRGIPIIGQVLVKAECSRLASDEGGEEEERVSIRH
jgi:hypothetical protein